MGRRRTLGLTVLVFAALGLAGYLAAPALVAHQVRARLQKLGDGYAGDLDGVELRLLRGEVAIRGLQIHKVDPPLRPAFLRARELVIAFTLEAGRLRNALRVVRPVMNLIDGPRPALAQWGPPFDLRELRERLPLELTRVEISNGSAHLRNFQSAPDLDAYVEGLDVSWTGLTHCLPPGTPACHSRFRADARVMGNAPLHVRGRYERDQAPELVAQVELEELPAKALSPLVAHYAKIDFQGGRMALSANFTRNGPRYEAVLVPRLTDLEVMGGDHDRTRFGRELGAALVAGYFERRSGEKALRVRGTMGRKDLDVELIEAPGK